MKKAFLFLMLVFGCGLRAGELVVADGGKSDYQIVVPDRLPNKSLDSFVVLGGKLIQTAIRKASGAEVPLVRESERKAGHPAILVGNTRALAAAGASTRDFVRWEHALKVVGQDIYVYGKDLPPLVKVPNPQYYFFYTVGSLKAACEFAEQFVNTRVVGPKYLAFGEHEGIRTLPKKRITVPADYSYRKKPRFYHNNGINGGLVYSVANNFFFNCGEEYCVHYHRLAIPEGKYEKTHPEYFAMIAGRRYFGSTDGIHTAPPQYCLSNPDVQKLIYQNALERADRGYRVVEFGQTDGFHGCECENCKAMYNTSDWGEKLWCLHRDMAGKLMKDRPEVIPAIACYGPTHQLPKSFDRFPGKGVIVDIAPISMKMLEGWKKFNLRGMATWNYMFCQYLKNGFSPARSMKDIRIIVKRLYDSPVTSIFNDGLMNVPAINGPFIYAFGQFCKDPEADAEKILSDYCESAFGPKAAPAMIRFFKLIDKRMEKYPLDDVQDFNNLEAYRNRRSVSTIVFWNNRYPPDVLAKLDKYFNEGMKHLPDSDPMADSLKAEYEYLRLSARACHAAAAVLDTPTGPARRQLADALDARNTFIRKLPLSDLPSVRGRIDPRYFWYPKLNILYAGGSMNGMFGSVFTMDTNILRQEKQELEAVKVKDFSDPAWKKIPVLTLQHMKGSVVKNPVSFQLAYTDSALLLKCTAPALKDRVDQLKRDDLNMWNNAVWEVFIAASQSMKQLAFCRVPGSAYDAVIKKKSVPSFNGNWIHEDTVSDGIWHSRVTIPFKRNCGRVPATGERWQIQIGFSGNNESLYAWNIPMNGKFADLSGFGWVRFGPRSPEKSRIVDVNGDFQQKNKKGLPLKWFVIPAKAKLEMVDGSMKVSQKDLRFTGLYSQSLIPLENDETAVISVTARGSGRVHLGLGWNNSAGNWIVNDHSRKDFDLTPEPKTYTFEFKLGRNEFKNAAFFCIHMFLKYPGGELILDRIKVEVKRQRPLL